ncbi:MAG: bifunctional UDP-N-acetylglucosamine diphosphorylase/glucosamine-1-phosphate N-acetyltransferase GlmU [Magnetococcales bacterium]|nr:bifunctional UDP-N-acetylglucosamine diphosphorylase/glucosamine-1-phosphate N-acetyltransferase GlmU [Magnetococcales bacterium]
MRSALPKVLHELAGLPLLAHVLEASRQLKPERLVVVIGHGADQVRDSLDAADITWVLQDEQLGTGHAVSCAMPALAGLEGELIVLNGDHPLIEPATLNKLHNEHIESGQAVTLLSTTIDPPTGYGRVVRDSSGTLLGIVEQKDADPKTLAITEVNSGTYCFKLTAMPAWLKRLSNNNAQGEYYLPDVVALAKADGLPVGACHHDDHHSLSGINSRRQLAQLEAAFRNRLVDGLMDRGVTFIDPGSCWLAADVQIGRDTIISPNVHLGPGVVIGEGCRVGPFCQIQKSHMGDGCEILAFCHLDGAQLAGPNVIGPYARLRPGTVLAAGAKVGNFCEVKKSNIGPGSKINHLTYVGDTEMGGGVNVGAGTITCNYDGVNKHRTVIGEGVFIGSDTQLVAPVTVGEGAVIGAGTTVTREVAAGSLATSRAPQKEIAGWREKRPKPKKK